MAGETAESLQIGKDAPHFDLDRCVGLGLILGFRGPVASREGEYHEGQAENVEGCGLHSVLRVTPARILPESRELGRRCRRGKNDSKAHWRQHMNRPVIILSILVVVLGAVVLRLTLFESVADESLESASQVGDGAREARRELEALKSRMGRLEQERDLARKDLQAERRRAAELDRALQKARQALAASKASLADDAKGRTERLAKVKSSIDALRGKGMETLVRSGAIGSIVGDLKALGPEGLKAVTDLLESEDSDDRLLAATILMSMDDPAAVEPLEKVAMSDDNELVAAMASQALMRMDNKTVVPALAKLMTSSKHDGVRVNAMYGLVRHDDPRGINATIDFLNDENAPAAMKRALGQGLLLLSNASALPAVDLVGERSSVRTNPQLSRMLVDYYGRVHNNAARDRLQSLLASGDLPSSTQDRVNQLLSGW